MLDSKFPPRVSLRRIHLLLVPVLALYAQPPDPPDAAPLPSETINRELPHWIQFSGEDRLRLEGYAYGGFNPGNDEMYLLNRFRWQVILRPARWLRVFAETQDSRVFWKKQHPSAPPYENTWDLRQAYADFGDVEKSPVALRFGRQEMSYGTERIIGVSSWSNTSRSFDAAKLILRHGKVRADLFAASVVVLQNGTVGSVQPGNNTYGIYVTTTDLLPGATIDPFVIWRLQPNITSETGISGHMDEKVWGLRTVGRLHRDFDYGATVMLERGDYSTDHLNALALHFLLGYTFSRAAWRPRIAVEYNYGSGDQDPRDGRHTTFDQLYPTSHDRYGLADQVGLRNMRHTRFQAEWNPARKWSAGARISLFWLASARDALYNNQGNAVARLAGGSGGRWIGPELDGYGSYRLNRYQQIGAGFGHIFPGTFLQRATPGHNYNAPYLFFTTKL